MWFPYSRTIVEVCGVWFSLGRGYDKLSGVSCGGTTTEILNLVMFPSRPLEPVKTAFGVRNEVVLPPGTLCRKVCVTRPP